VGRIVQCYLNADLRAGHEGLAKLAAKDGIKVKDLEPGHCVIFINSGKDKLKMYAANNVIAYLRLDTGRLNMNTIQFIPHAFRAGKIDYDKVLRETLTSHLVTKKNMSALDVARAMA
jgi:hypothetical protein